MELKNIWEIIRHRKWWVLQALVIISLTATIGVFFIPPIYETSSKVYISSSDSTSSLLSNIGMSGLSSMIGSSEVDVETYIELAKLDPILKKVIQELQLRDADGNLIEPEDMRETNFFTGKLFPTAQIDVEQTEDADIIEITASSPFPAESAMVANTLAETFIQENLKQSREEYGSAKKFIEEQLELARAEYLNALQAIKEYKIVQQTVDIEEETKVAIEKIGELMKEKEDNIIDLSETRAKIKTLRKQLHVGKDGVIPSSAISANPQIEDLKKKLSDLDQDLAGALTDKKPEHPDVLTIQRKIKALKAELQKELSIFQKSSKDMEILERDLAALEVHLVGVNADIEKYTSLLYTIPEKAFMGSQLNAKLDASQKIYSDLLEYLYEVGVAEAMTLSDIRLVEPAYEPKPDKWESPNRILVATGGSLLGLLFGLGLAFFVEHLDDSIKNSEDVKKQGFLFLGTIPHRGKKDPILTFAIDTKDPFREAWRTIRNNLKFASLDKPIKSMLVTSSMPSEGKTATTMNLAFSLAQEKKKVLVVDLDLLRPRIHKELKLTVSTGVTNILSGETILEEAIQETETEGLYVLPCGPVPPDPANLVESLKMKELIKHVIDKFDVVIVDTPPLFVTNDPIILAGYVDAVLLVVECRKTTRQALAHANDLLKQASIQPIGAILNKFEMARRADYYSYYYKAGYYRK